MPKIKTEAKYWLCLACEEIYDTVLLSKKLHHKVLDKSQ